MTILQFLQSTRLELILNKCHSPAKIEYSVVDSNANICNTESHRNRLVIYSFESKYHP